MLTVAEAWAYINATVESTTKEQSREIKKGMNEESWMKETISNSDQET